MKINPAGLGIIQEFEGERLVPYQDGNGIWTVGYGHTEGEHAGSPAISDEEAQALLDGDVAWAEKAVARAIRSAATENEFSAMVSLCFNIGSGNFTKSTLLRDFNYCDKAAAAAQFLKWSIIAGQPSAGLLRRRRAEQTLFLS